MSGVDEAGWPLRDSPVVKIDGTTTVLTVESFAWINWATGESALLDADEYGRRLLDCLAGE